MIYRIEEKEAFNIVGIMKRVPIIFEGENQEITANVEIFDYGKNRSITKTF